MAFFFKYVVAFALLCLILPWRSEAPATAASGRRAAAAADSVSSLARDGANRLAQAAQERCLAQPRRCLETAQALRRAALGSSLGLGAADSPPSAKAGLAREKR